MATVPPNDAETEFVRDENGILRTVEEMRELEEEEQIIAQGIRAQIQERGQNVRAAHPVAFSIPQELYKKAADAMNLVMGPNEAQHQVPSQSQAPTLTTAERELLLSRGDLQGRVLANSAASLTRAERYQVIGWPDPDVVDRRIRAATGGRLSSPAELFAKATDENSLAIMTPEELQLAACQFRLPEEDGDQNLQSSVCGRTAVPGNNEAYTAALQEEGVTLASLMLVTMENSKRQIETLKARYPAAGAGAMQFWGNPSTPQAFGEVPFPFPFPAQISQGGTSFQQIQPMGMGMAAPFGAPHGAPFATVGAPMGVGATVGNEASIGGPAAAPIGIQPVGTSQSFGTPIRASVGPPFQPPPGIESSTTTTLSAPAIAGSANVPVPDNGQTARVVEEIADALESLKQRRKHRHINEQEYDIGYDSIVSSLHGLSLRFDAPPSPFQMQSPMIYRPAPPPPPPYTLGPNPFGLRLTHDGLNVTPADPFMSSDPAAELPPGSTQTPPWTVWSKTIPYRMRQPHRAGMAFTEYITAIQEWTNNEEREWQTQGPPQGGQRFYNTPPSWPITGDPKHPFRVFYDEIKDTEAAKAWPAGEIAYARKEWDALPASAQDAYTQRCEDVRRQTWAATLEPGARPW